MCNLGGVAPSLVRPAGSSRVWAIDGVGNWGREVTLDGFLARHGGEMPLGSPVGVVPAAFDAWCTLLSRFGTWRLRDAIAPALDLARRGFVLDEVTATALRILGSGFSAYPSSVAAYWPKGRAPRAGETLALPDLARTLSRLSACDDALGREDGIAAAARSSTTATSRARRSPSTARPAARSRRRTSPPIARTPTSPPTPAMRAGAYRRPARSARGRSCSRRWRSSTASIWAPMAAPITCTGWRRP